MGYQMTKPHLRAAMEKDCALVARGQMPKATMITNCLHHMRQAFQACSDNAAQLDVSVSKYFQTLGADAAAFSLVPNGGAFSLCGTCGNGMDLKQSAAGGGGGGGGGGGIARRLLHCRTCSVAHSVPSTGELAPLNFPSSTLPDGRVDCAICGFQVLQCRLVWVWGDISLYCILLVSCFMCSGARDSAGILLP